MNTEKLLKYITSPQTLNRDSLEEIHSLVQLFPFSQNVQLLYLFNLSNTQDIRFGEQLQKTATYAADRRLLKKQIEELKKPFVSVPKEQSVQTTSEYKPQIEIIPEPQDLTDDLSIQVSPLEDNIIDNEKLETPLAPLSGISAIHIYDNKEENDPLQDLISERNKMRSKAELLQLVKKRLSLIEEIKAEKPIESDSSDSRTEAEIEAPILSKLDLIDKFIRVEPSISRPEKTAFFDPEVAAQESLFEDGEFVTETLARIYYDQGNYRKAKEIYQSLSLNNPEKSSYFAALIQKLENKLN